MTSTKPAPWKVEGPQGQQVLAVTWLVVVGEEGLPRPEGQLGLRVQVAQ